MNRVWLVQYVDTDDVVFRARPIGSHTAAKSP
jgi:hypothetical protein